MIEICIKSGCHGFADNFLLFVKIFIGEIVIAPAFFFDVLHAAEYGAKSIMSYQD